MELSAKSLESSLESSNSEKEPLNSPLTTVDGNGGSEMTCEVRGRCLISEFGSLIGHIYRGFPEARREVGY